MNIIRFLFISPRPILSIRVAGVAVRDIQVLANSTAELTCDTVPDDRTDEVILVLWFRENISAPIFRQVEVHGFICYLHFFVYVIFVSFLEIFLERVDSRWLKPPSFQQLFSEAACL